MNEHILFDDMVYDGVGSCSRTGVCSEAPSLGVSPGSKLGFH